MGKRLVKGEKKVFGVCSGIANYFNIDPTLVRLLFLISFFCYGSGFLLYLLLTVLMEDE